MSENFIMTDLNSTEITINNFTGAFTKLQNEAIFKQNINRNSIGSNMPLDLLDFFRKCFITLTTAFIFHFTNLKQTNWKSKSCQARRIVLPIQFSFKILSS